MRTIEEAKNDAAEYAISQYFPQCMQSMAEMNEQYIQCQSTSVIPNAMIPSVSYVAAADTPISTDESNSQSADIDQTSNIPSSSIESNSALVQSPYVLSQPSHIPPINPQYVLDSNGKLFLNKKKGFKNSFFYLGQYILYPTQTFY